MPGRPIRSEIRFPAFGRRGVGTGPIEGVEFRGAGEAAVREWYQRVAGRTWLGRRVRWLIWRRSPRLRRRLEELYASGRLRCPHPRVTGCHVRADFRASPGTGVRIFGHELTEPGTYRLETCAVCEKPLKRNGEDV